MARGLRPTFFSLEELAFRGNSGETYIFQVRPSTSPLPSSSGVYLLLEKLIIQPSYNVLYVGRTDDLRDRQQDHLRKVANQGATLLGSQITHVAHREISVSEYMRYLVELDLYNWYKPPKNKIKPAEPRSNLGDIFADRR